MTPQRFEEVETLYHAVRNAPAAERAVILAGTDPDLRSEVESLLAERSGSDFLSSPAMINAPELLPDDTFDGLSPGVCLGPYRIESRLGAGGMGEVYRAVDMRLGRAVAIKLMRKEFSIRFEHEARAISALNHPHICTLFDVGPNYLVMELVEGETLRALLKARPLPEKTALLYGSQILAALTEAHGKGIVHRDLKPGNIMIAKAGVKVLDFGLAKSGADETETAGHFVMGTPAYMAPEQRAGEPADARTDIYSFGWVLHEMLTGTRAGTRRKWLRSRRLERIVSRCLEEEREKRWPSVDELERALVIARTNQRAWYGVAAAVLVITTGAAVYFSVNRAPKLGEKDTIVLADFDNKTGEAVFDDTLRAGLLVELQQSPFLSVTSDRQVEKTLALMGQPKTSRLSAVLAEQVCERSAGAAVLEGSIARMGSRYLLTLRAKKCDTGDLLDQEQATASRREEMVNALSQMGRSMRVRLGESQGMVAKHSVPLAEATTHSLEALKAYSAGIKTVTISGTAAAIPFFQRAVEIDPTFAMAQAMVGLTSSSNGESVLSARSTIRAWELRERVSDRERFFIDFTYARQVTGNLEKAYRTLELWQQTYPRGAEPNPQSLMGGLSTHGTGRFDEAIRASQETIANDPDFALAYVNLAGSYFLTDRLLEARQALERAAERKLEMADFLAMRYNIAAVLGESGEMDRLASRARGMRRAEHWVAHARALTQARSGQIHAARQSESEAVNLATQEGEKEAAASYLAARAEWEALCGNMIQARTNANAALELSRGRDVEYAAGLGFGLDGNSLRAEALADDLEKRFPEDTFAKFTYVPILRALTATDRKKAAESIEILHTALRYELAANGLNFNHLYLGGLHSAYVRGEALRAARRYREAAAEFQKLIDHRGLVGLDPMGALARLQLARAYLAMGDRDKAKNGYESFLTLWKDADGDVPVFEQAEREYGQLSP